jgi:GntR family transcriptional regulator
VFKIDLKNRTPIYEQVVDGFKRQVLSGQLSENSRVPSVRDMAKELGVNPNTVQKAYRELEMRGFIYTVAGQGSFIAAVPEAENAKEIESLYGRLTSIVQELKFRGQTPQQIIERGEMA